MNLAVVTLDYGKFNKVVSSLSIPNFQQYCDKHGYDLCVETEIVDVERPMAWSKHIVLQEYLPRYDWVYWIDTDCLIMNHTMKLETLIDDASDMIIGMFMIPEGLPQSPYILHTGGFLIRNCDWSLEYLHRVYAETNSIMSYSVDETAVTDLYRRNRSDRDHIKLVHFKHLCSVNEHYRDGHFVWHFARRHNLERARLMTDALERVTCT